MKPLTEKHKLVYDTGSTTWDDKRMDIKDWWELFEVCLDKVRNYMEEEIQ